MDLEKEIPYFSNYEADSFIIINICSSILLLNQLQSLRIKISRRHNGCYHVLLSKKQDYGTVTMVITGSGSGTGRIGNRHHNSRKVSWGRGIKRINKTMLSSQNKMLEFRNRLKMFALLLVVSQYSEVQLK